MKKRPPGRKTSFRRPRLALEPERVNVRYRWDGRKDGRIHRSELDKELSVDQVVFRAATAAPPGRRRWLSIAVMSSIQRIAMALLPRRWGASLRRHSRLVDPGQSTTISSPALIQRVSEISDGSGFHVLHFRRTFRPSRGGRPFVIESLDDGPSAGRIGGFAMEEEILFAHGEMNLGDLAMTSRPGG